MKSTRHQTYGQILKSSAVIGGSTLFNLGLSVIRTKAMAVLLGPAGVGLLGLYGAIADLGRTFACMGLNNSGVRQIAESASTGDTARLACTVTTLRRVAVLLGILGALLLAAFCRPISRFSFGEERFAGAVALLALAVFFGTVSSGQLALVQGMRRIGDLARSNVLGGFYGTLLSVAVIFFYRERGVVPSLVCVAAMGFVASWWFSRKIKVEHVRWALGSLSGEVAALLKLGLVFMASGLMSMGVGYLARLIVLRKLGIEAAGFYQAAWALGGLYVGFILQAMGADFFPRLTAVARDDAECNRLVNEQAEVSLLLAGPGVLGTLTFAPLVIQVFYSAKFGPAVEILRWICLGMVLRVVSWPMGFILLAKGARQPYFWSELLSNVAQVGFLWIGLLAFGLTGIGLGFFAAYAFYWIMIYLVVRRISGFRWTAANKQIGLLYSSLILAVFVAWYVLPGPVVAVGGLALTLLTGLHSLKKVLGLIPLEQLPALVRRWVNLLGLAPAGPQLLEKVRIK